jgi:hypothetical protein
MQKKEKLLFAPIARTKKRPPQYPPQNERPWRTEKEAADHIGVRPSKMRKMRYEGTGPVWYKASGSGCIRYLVSELDSWIARNSRH